MGRGSRHSKNAGTMGSEAMTYAEKRSLGYGTSYERVAKESIGKFDDCQLTLQSAFDPVCTPFGVIYSREAIITYLAHQKKNIKQEFDTWKELQTKARVETMEQLAIDEQVKLAEFERLNYHGMCDVRVNQIHKLPNEAQQTVAQSKILISGGTNIETNRERIKHLRAFWGGSMTPESRPILSTCKNKPNDFTTCPITGAKLKLKDLITLKFTRSQTTDNNTKNQTTSYIDPITKDFFTNRSRLVCLRPSGAVMLHDTYKTFVEPDGIYDGYKIQKKDVIELQKGGTGYADHDRELITGSKLALLGLGSGLTDLRGQHSGSGTKSGLVLL